MSNISRRQDLGLGKTAAGGSGGSFAAHERSAGSPPAPASGSSAKLNRIVDRRTQQLDQLADMRQALEEKEAEVQRALLSAKVQQMFGEDEPKVTTAVFYHAEDNRGQLRLSGLKRSDGSNVDMDIDMESEFSEFVDELGFYDHSAWLDDPFEIDGYDPDYPQMTLVEPSLPNALDTRRFVDVQDESSFNQALSDAHNDGRIIGSVRTRAQFEDELRSNLSDLANEQNSGERETYFDDGDVDAWVNDAISRYETNKPDERDDDLAFRDAIDAARPQDH